MHDLVRVSPVAIADGRRDDQPPLRIGLAGQCATEVGAVAAHTVKRNQNLQRLAGRDVPRCADEDVLDLGSARNAQRGKRRSLGSECLLAARREQNQGENGSQRPQLRGEAEHCRAFIVAKWPLSEQFRPGAADQPQGRDSGWGAGGGGGGGAASCAGPDCAGAYAGAGSGCAAVRVSAISRAMSGGSTP